MTAAPFRLLLLEDNAGDARLARTAHAEHAPAEFAITRVERLADALARIASEHFDAVLCDLGLPDSTGLATAQAIAARAPALPLVVLTGSHDEDLGREAIRQGAQDYVIKGEASGSMVARTLHYAIERKRLEIGIRAANESLALRVAERTAELEAAIKQLSASETRFRSFTEMSSDFYWESDVEHRLTLLGSGGRAKGVPALQQGARIGKRRWELPYLSPDEAGWQAHRAVLDACQPFRDFEFSRLDTNGTERHISVSGDAVFDASGAFRGYRGVGNDITERKRAELALRESEEKYRRIYDSLQDSYVETALDGTILEISPQVEMLSGGQYKREDLLGRSAKAFYADAERGAAFLRTLTLVGSVKDFESAFINRDGSAVPCSISAMIRHGADGKPGSIVSTVRDISGRKRAQESLRESEEKLRAIFESALDGILVADAESKKFLTGNPTICRMLGYTLEEMVRIGVSDIHPKQDLPRVMAEFERRQCGEIRLVADIPVIRKDGSVFHADIQFAPIRLGGSNCLLGHCRDVTERKHAAEALHDNAKRLRGLSRRLIAVEETARRNINRELHDRVGQNLAALNINLNIIRSQLPQESRDAVGARLRDTQTLLEGMAAQVRDVMADLHPPALDDFGLLAALRVYAESFGARFAVPITVYGEDLTPRLPLAAETALFRIAQEALANAAAHARATRVQVLFAATPDRVTLTIADDGAGFDAAHAALAHASWGLAIMRERAEAVGAALRIDTAPGRGTRVVVEIEREAA